MSGPGPGVARRPSARLIATLVAGILAVLAGTVLGGAGPLLQAIVSPPLPVRAALVGVAVVIGAALLARAIAAFGQDERPPGVAGMIRGVRLAFLAVAAFAAAAGWLVGHALPLVMALVIAGVDIVETAFLLIVADRQHEHDSERGSSGTQP